MRRARGRAMQRAWTRDRTRAQLPSAGRASASKAPGSRRSGRSYRGEQGQQPVGRLRLMVRMTRFLVAAASIPGLVLCTASCSPRNTKASYAGADIGQPAAAAYGRIVSMRPVLMQAGNTGAAVSAASFADGSDVRGNIL